MGRDAPPANPAKSFGGRGLRPASAPDRVGFTDQSGRDSLKAVIREGIATKAGTRRANSHDPCLRRFVRGTADCAKTVQDVEALELPRQHHLRDLWSLLATIGALCIPSGRQARSCPPVRGTRTLGPPPTLPAATDLGRPYALSSLRSLNRFLVLKKPQDRHFAPDDKKGRRLRRPRTSSVTEGADAAALRRSPG